MADQSIGAIALTDKRGHLTYVNPAYERLHAVSAYEVLGQEAPLLAFARANLAIFHRMWAEMAAGRSWSGRYASSRGNSHIFEVENSISPIRDQAGRIINFYAHHRDVTQEERLREHLRQTHKMEAIGTLAGGIAHDFNNILVVISGYAELARMNLQDPQRASNYLEQAYQGWRLGQGLGAPDTDLQPAGQAGEKASGPVTGGEGVPAPGAGHHPLDHRYPPTAEQPADHAMRETGGQMSVTLSPQIIDEREI